MEVVCGIRMEWNVITFSPEHRAITRNVVTVLAGVGEITAIAQ